MIEMQNQHNIDFKIKYLLILKQLLKHKKKT